jgi:hypothetical protein
MINLTKYKFTDNDDEWMFEEPVSGFEEFLEDNSNQKGYLTFHVEMENNDGDDFERPQVFQQNALNYFFKNQATVLNALCQGVIDHAPEFIKLYGAVFPELKSIAEVKKNVSISSIHILGSQKENHSYLGFDCWCSWDDEHGLGVLMHKDRCIDAGDHLVASLSYEKILQDQMTAEEWSIYEEEQERNIAENIARLNKENEERLKLEAKEARLKASKKWWQFWKK